MKLRHFSISKATHFFLAIFVVTISSLTVLAITLESQTLNHQALTLMEQAHSQEQYLQRYHQANLTLQEIASKSATLKSQGVATATVEARLAETRDEIAAGNFGASEGTLLLLSKDLDSLLAAKLSSDKKASEEAKRKAEEEAKRRAAQAAAQPTTAAPVTTSDPNSLGFGYSRTTVSTRNGNFSIHLIKANLSGARVIMDSANDNDCANGCPTLSLSDYVGRNGATYGINGTYFCPPDYASCAGKVASYDFPIFNTRLGRWINQGNLYWTNRAMMTFPGGGAAFYPSANSAPQGGYGAAIVSSPGLVHNGADIVGQYQLTSAQTTKGSRGGLGIKGNVLFMVIASGANMNDLAAIFQALGADHALNIDGGGSSALWAGGYRAGPGRSLPNALVIAQ